MKLFTTHKTPFQSCPTGLKSNLEQWSKLNPTLLFEYLSDNEMCQWVQNNSSPNEFECFNYLNTGAGRADFYRIKKLYVEGGIWVDADLPAIDILSKSPNLMGMLDQYQTGLFVTKNTNEPRFMIMASKPNNPIFRMFENQMCLEISECHVNKKDVLTIDLTGPKAFQRMLCGFLGYKKISDLRVGENHSVNNGSFIFLPDVVEHNEEHKAICRYKGYKNDLRKMQISHWSGAPAIVTGRSDRI